MCCTQNNSIRHHLKHAVILDHTVLFLPQWEGPGDEASKYCAGALENLVMYQSGLVPRPLSLPLLPTKGLEMKLAMSLAAVYDS